MSGDINLTSNFKSAKIWIMFLFYKLFQKRGPCVFKEDIILKNKVSMYLNLTKITKDLPWIWKQLVALTCMLRKKRRKKIRDRHDKMNRYVDEFSVTLLLYGSLDHIYLPILFRAITVTIYVTFIFLTKINALRVTNMV